MRVIRQLFVVPKVQDVEGLNLGSERTRLTPVLYFLVARTDAYDWGMIPNVVWYGDTWHVSKPSDHLLFMRNESKDEIKQKEVLPHRLSLGLINTLDKYDWMLVDPKAMSKTDPKSVYYSKHPAVYVKMPWEK